MKSRLGDLLKTLAATLVVFAVAEVVIRAAYFVRNSVADSVALPYVIGHDYGPLPPWLDGLRILEPDEGLLWRSRPHLRRKYIDVFSPVRNEEQRLLLLRRFLPTLPADLTDNPTWEISLNSDGFRDVEFPEKGPGRSFRILCLGDSWTFGANVGQEQAYPARLEALLRGEFPGAGFEVLNLGVLGYSSFQGLELLKQRIDALEPDLAVIAYTMNDSAVAGWHDADLRAQQRSDHWTDRLGAVLERIESYKLVRYWALVLRWRGESISDLLRRTTAAAEKPHEALDYGQLAAWTRVPVPDYGRNVRAMIDLARSRGAEAILLYNGLSADAGEVAGIGRVGQVSPYRAALEEISRQERVPLVDASVLVARAKRRIEEELEQKLGLQPSPPRQTPPGQEIEVIFRVYTGDRPVPKSVYIVGAHPKLGDGVPNRVALYDDGTRGDQKAGDAVWSLAATFSPGTTGFYVYTNSGEEGEWEGLDVPHLRRLTVDAGHRRGHGHLPIETFGEIHMQADGWHTNALGYELIARAVLDVLKGHERIRAHLRQASG